MARTGSGRRRSSRGVGWDVVDRLTVLGLQVGGGAFVLVSVYLLWGIISGTLTNLSSLAAEDLQRVLKNVQFACKVLTASGVVLVFSGAIRYYLDEITGYLLLISGAVLHWGIPMAVGSSLQQVSFEAASLPAYVTAQYSLVGVVALVAAVPFIIADFWFKLRGVQRRTARGAIIVSKEEELPRSRFHIFCWQMPYCRDYLRKFCRAYEQRKSCWRIKSGCYCDEDMILRVMKRSSTSKVPGFDQRYTEVAGKTKDLTPAQKRQRCRQCFLYQEHQKQKYRMLSPLAFPAGVAIMWVYLKPVKLLLHEALEFTDRFAGQISFGTGAQQAVTSQWANAPATSNTIEWLFLVCIGLILVTYLLRALEYFVFDLQV